MGRAGGRYSGSKGAKTGMGRWFKEKWRNQRGGVGYKRKSDVYRPTRRVTRKTPKTYRQISRKRLAAARRTKARTGRVKRFKKRKAEFAEDDAEEPPLRSFAEVSSKLSPCRTASR